MEVVPLSLVLPMLGVALWCVWAAHTVPKPPKNLELLPSPPFPPPLYQSSPLPPLSPGGPSAHHLCGGISTGLPVSIGVVAGGSLVSASESQTPPQPFDPAAPPWLLAPSSPPWPISPPALPWSIVDHPWPRDSTPLATPCPSVPLALSDSFPPATSWSSVALAPSRPSGSPPLPQSPEPSALPWPSGSYPSPWLSVSASGSATVGRPPGVVSLSSTMAPPSVSCTVGCHHGCDLGPAWLLWLPSVFSLTPPSIGSTLVPSVSFLAPPSVWSALDSVGHPPPGYPATS